MEMEQLSVLTPYDRKQKEAMSIHIIYIFHFRNGINSFPFRLLHTEKETLRYGEGCNEKKRMRYSNKA